jgi:hypothetical protein
MRIPVFARGANPRVDRPILRKSKRYTDDQVAAGRADYIDPLEPAKGIICRELIYFGPRTVIEPPATTTSVSMAELPGLKFVPPQTEKNPTLQRIHVDNILIAAISWDWSLEAAACSHV